MKKTIYSYYESLQARNQAEEFECANIWKATWEAAGWNTVMLNTSHAKISPLYQKLMGKLLTFSAALPSELQNIFPEIQVKFSRWCALHAAGGGWMSDYDVVNKSFTCADADEIEKTNSIYIFNREKCCLFYANSDLAMGSVMRFISEDLHEGSLLKKEADILGFTKETNQIGDKVIHVGKKNSEKKSENMKKIA
jgi:hypothetical protein